MDRRAAIGIRDLGFELTSVKDLVHRGILERPIDGNHGEIHPKSEDFVEDGVPFIMASDLRAGYVDYEGCAHITERQAEGLRKGFAQNGDVLLTHKATIGETAIVDYEKHPYVMLTPQVTYYRVKDREILNHRYLKHYFDSSLFQQTLHMLASSGSTRAYLGITEQQRLPVILPPPGKQKKIAAILSAYDDLIANNQRRIALLETMAEEIYREWFVRMRFPGAKPNTFTKGLPKDWTDAAIGGAFQFFGGATPSKEMPRYWLNGEVNWFTPTDITAAEGIYLESSRDRCTEEGLADCSANLFPAYSIMMTSRATIGAIGINTVPACTNQGFITCIPNDQYPLTYLYHWLKLAKPHFEMLSGGSTFAELTKGTFKRIRILTPATTLVSQFEKLVRPMFDEMETLQKANRRLKDTRDSLLPRLISGKLRVDHLDIQLPPSMRAEQAERAQHPT
jgi:type I restriction enzyme S subunit